MHVAPAGTAGAEFTSLPTAVAAARPGDTVLVAAGEYREPRGVPVKVSGRPDAWIKIKAAPGARPRIISSGWEGFGLIGGIGYVEIDGFELIWIFNPAIVGDKGNRVHGSGVAMQYATHHIRVLNNIIHGYGTGGIISLDCDYLHIEGNLIYDCAKTSPYGGSAISLCRAFDFDRDPGYHNVIRGNVAHDNELKVIVAVTSGGIPPSAAFLWACTPKARSWIDTFLSLRLEAPQAIGEPVKCLLRFAELQKLGKTCPADEVLDLGVLPKTSCS